VRMRRKLVPAALGMALVLLLPGSAWAPRVHGLPNYEGPCEVGNEAGTFVGAVFVRGYQADGSSLVAELSVTGTCAVDGTDHSLNDAQASSALSIEKSNCNKLTLRLGEAVSGGVTVDLSTAAMRSKATRDDRAGFCELARVIRSDPPPEDVAKALSDFFS
jgi:hypothetical protein